MALTGMLSRLSTSVAVCLIILTLTQFQSSDGIAIRPFQHRTLVNGVNCSTETALATLGCYCLLNGQHCAGNLKCVNNVCVCPPAFITLTSTGACVPPNYIYINCSSNITSFGWTNCFAGLQFTSVPGLIIGGNKPTTCTLTVITSTTPPTNVPAYDDSTDYLSVNAVTGQVYFNGGPLAPGTISAPVGPSEANTMAGSEPLVQTYQAQCTDSRGVVSNTLTFNISWATIDSLHYCNLDGTCCDGLAPG